MKKQRRTHTSTPNTSWLCGVPSTTTGTVNCTGEPLNESPRTPKSVFPADHMLRIHATRYHTIMGPSISIPSPLDRKPIFRSHRSERHVGSPSPPFVTKFDSNVVWVRRHGVTRCREKGDGGSKTGMHQGGFVPHCCLHTRNACQAFFPRNLPTAISLSPPQHKTKTDNKIGYSCKLVPIIAPYNNCSVKQQRRGGEQQACTQI